MRKLIVTIIVIVLAAPALSAQQPLTTAEKTDYERTSLYADVMEFIYAVQKKNPLVKIVEFCVSAEGRTVPLVVLSEEGISSPYELGMTGKDAVLIQANIHAGEVEGKEASQMLIRDIAGGELAHLLENQVVLVIPILNADGNEKLSPHNRRDNGPELAGTRANGQNLDLNRDYPKLESPEITALVELFNTWDPVLTVDMHTKTLVITRNNPAPVLLARDEEITCLETPSDPIGFRRNTRPSISEVPLEVGLTVVVYTDGIVHAGSRDGQSMDVATCLQSILDEGNPPAIEIADSLLEHALKLDQGRPVDDTSVMVLRVMEQTDDSKIRRMMVSLPFG